MGRRWVFACATVLTLGLTTLGARADSTTANTDTAAAATTSATTDKSVNNQSQTLKTTVASDATTDTSKSDQATSTDTASQTATNDDDATQTTASSSSDSQKVVSGTTDASSTTSQTTQSVAGTTKQADTADKSTTKTTAADATATTTAAKASTDTDATKSSTSADSDDTTSTDSNNAKAATTDTDTASAVTATTDTTAAETSTDTNDTTATTNSAKTTAQMVSAQTVATTLSQAVTQANDAVADGGNVTDDYPDLHNMLGVSSQFHIFAREAELHAHTNGNIAVQNLVGNVNFGTNIIEELLDKDISYIQNITNIAGSSFVSAGETRSNKVIFGENIDIDVSNPNRPMVNGVYIDHLLASEVYQDKDGNVYIDFDAEFAKLEKLSASLSEQTANATYSNDSFDDMNQRVIDVTDMEPDADGHIVINLSADVLNTSTPLTIKGLSADPDGNTVIINVDTAGSTNYQVNSQIKIIYDDGTERNNQETEDFGDNHLLWNFYDSTASDKLATGVISVDRPFQGSILAPAAEIDANQNIDGNLIANKVNVKAETHRWDLQDNVDNENDPDTDEPDPTEPEDPEPVEPGGPAPIDPEEPGTNEPEPNEPEPSEPEEPGTNEPEPNEPEPNEPEEPEFQKPVHPTLDVEMPNFDEDEDEEEAEPDEETPVEEPEVPDEETPDEEEPVEEPEEPDEEAPDEVEYQKPEHPIIDVEMPDFDEIDDEAEAEEAEEEFEDEIEDEIEAGVEPDEIVDQIVDEVENEIDAGWVTDETVEELETAFEEVQKEAVIGDQINDEETLLNLIDQAIAQAKAHHNSALVAQLQALRTKVAAALAVAQGKSLPQTSETSNQAISLAGIALASTLMLGAYASRRKRQN
ncbi:LPXTG cell wall anchor domain-containing protein [Lactiplantibacillus pentosus]|uniref:collagen-binding domain-containing protein n=1 Tax=Lactiplantibacillus pentosus TaxID=1589 RepID=UPI00067CEE0B|nr:collagen-binding domain-containing protein [Lactiplantibacillus pentosus]AYJ42861.1 LPXTG cell wall anchor domain-containing protein [Lactiplantibacillus pentosus]MCT3298267.1 LPXTG cell wall anchor domain-containing protein [Lactiplantibacillus pentosus]MCT3312192.1 LPXTG cell wall anchor domain-containing protein [Lactiplantibacillus pentosus]MCT3328490.1 LPXTG cell wall anchor domain-containing protein [Lactiplantibacillus pentosus]PKX56690.1 cell surface protein [Lactiplantibacillus pen